MEMNSLEIMTLADAVSEVIETATEQLSELQLALVGGGCGEVVFA